MNLAKDVHETEAVPLEDEQKRAIGLPVEPMETSTDEALVTTG